LGESSLLRGTLQPPAQAELAGDGCSSWGEGTALGGLCEIAAF